MYYTGIIIMHILCLIINKYIVFEHLIEEMVIFILTKTDALGKGISLIYQSIKPIN